jgi:hypothetical protein
MNLERILREREKAHLINNHQERCQGDEGRKCRDGEEGSSGKALLFKPDSTTDVLSVLPLNTC